MCPGGMEPALLLNWPNLMQERLDARLWHLPPDALHDLLRKVSEIDEFRGWWRGCDLSGRVILERRKKQVVQISARASAQIDGRALSGTRAEGLSSGTGMARPEVRHSSRAQGYAELLRAVFDGHEEMTFGEDLILQFHARLLTYSLEGSGGRGRYRTGFDKRPAHIQRSRESFALRPAAPHLVPGEMKAVTEWAAARFASSDFHPLLLTASFILEFLAIRPFAHGNGRMSRILTNFFLLQSGYSYIRYASLEKVIADQWAEYYLALRRSQANRNLPVPDIKAWLFAFLDALRAQIGEVKTAIAELTGERLLSENQLGVLDLLERNEEVTNRLVCCELGIPKDTAKQVLNRLLALDMVRRVGAGRAVRYRRSQLLAE